MTPDLLLKGFEALQYIDNPYALVAFILLIGLIGAVAMNFAKVEPRIKVGFPVALAILVAVFVYLFLKTTMTQVQDELLVHIVRDSGRGLVAKGVEVQLVDIESLKGKGGWEFNANLPDIQHVLHEVFARASVEEMDWNNMNEKKWAERLTSLETSDDLAEKIRAKMIEDTGFARFRVFVDGMEDRSFEHKYYFKNEYLCIPSHAPGEDDSCSCSRAKLQVVNLYNTIHHSSGEPEAAVLRVIRK